MVVGRLPELPDPNRSGRFQIQPCYGNKEIKEKHLALMQQVNNCPGERRLYANLLYCLLPLPLKEAAAPSANLEKLFLGI